MYNSYDLIHIICLDSNKKICDNKTCHIRETGFFDVEMYYIKYKQAINCERCLELLPLFEIQQARL